ncbi:hypothetical protein RR48_04010 [Papilio machaon]|uniref:Uncharacterized protein n=1 Tax=Papilio machaon TaxID=76193 RepID=A0A0N1PHH1_PAPMA|nr:hypothetical protein RR48_04010 [Papilio machaon]
MKLIARGARLRGYGLAGRRVLRARGVCGVAQGGGGGRVPPACRVRAGAGGCGRVQAGAGGHGSGETRRPPSPDVHRDASSNLVKQSCRRDVCRTRTYTCERSGCSPRTDATPQILCYEWFLYIGACSTKKPAKARLRHRAAQSGTERHGAARSGTERHRAAPSGTERHGVLTT